MAILRTGLILVITLYSVANAKGFPWFFKHIHPSGKCPFSMVEIPVSFYWTGRKTANGEAFDANGNTAASRYHRFGTRIRLYNPTTHKEVVVRINDRGPYGVAHHLGIRLDLARGAARRLGLTQSAWVCASER